LERMGGAALTKLLQVLLSKPHKVNFYGRPEKEPIVSLSGVEDHPCLILLDRDYFLETNG